MFEESFILSGSEDEVDYRWQFSNADDIPGNYKVWKGT